MRSFASIYKHQNDYCYYALNTKSWASLFMLKLPFQWNQDHPDFISSELSELPSFPGSWGGLDYQIQFGLNYIPTLRFNPVQIMLIHIKSFEIPDTSFANVLTFKREGIYVHAHTLWVEWHWSWTLIFTPFTLTSSTQAEGGWFANLLLHATCEHK